MDRTRARGVALAAAGLVLVAGAAPAGAGVTKRVSVSSGGVQGDSASGSDGVAISADGRFVAFGSDADNLVPGDTNALLDVFVRDRRTGATEPVSVGPGGTQPDNNSGSPSVSANGRLVAFSSYATDLVPGDTNGDLDVFVHHR